MGCGIHENRNDYQKRGRQPDDPRIPMNDRLIAAAQRMLDAPGEGGEILRGHQIPAFLKFTDYLTDLATSPNGDALSSFSRIVLPPRTGKTVVAGKIISMSGLTATFVVPTKALVRQTAKEFRLLMPDIPIGFYYSDIRKTVSRGVNITTYSTLHRRLETGRLPGAIRSSALVFADEAHHAMTKFRYRAMQRAFHQKAVRIALTATPDYNKDRRLEYFFPNLIHELELHDAFDLGLLAPSRMWAVEVDSDASRIRLIAGDFDQDTLGRLMSATPFFKAAETFRYARPNRNLPALITCISRQQAYDLWRYLETHRPKKTPSPGLILGETPSDERDRLLSNFSKGRVDTLIQVGVLIEGWNAPNCKLLIDLAPSASRVRATQKYFRVMTRYKDQEARIVVILPTRMPGFPILPVDLMLKPGECYECGELMEPGQQAGGGQAPVAHMEKSPVKSVRIKSRVIASASLRKPDLDPDNPKQIRQVLNSCPDFQLHMKYGCVGFRRLFFNHSLFVGSGGALLQYLGVPNGRAAYDDLMLRLFPDEFGMYHVERAPGGRDEDWTDCSDDLRHLIENGLTPKTKNKEAHLGETLRALSGGAKKGLSPEEFLIFREQVDLVMIMFGEVLNERTQFIFIHRLGLFGNPEQTWDWIAWNLDLSKERVRQIYLKGARLLKRAFIRRVAPKQRYPIITDAFEYPDIFRFIENL